MTDLVVTNSLLKSFGRCPRISLYKHHDLIARKAKALPLERGSWFHELMETYYDGGDVEAVHKQLTHRFSMLYDEEKDQLGDLPKEVWHLWLSYKWHYHGDTDWTVHETEFKLTATLPNGVEWQGKSDMLVENESGLWIVDHKTHRILPSLTSRLLDTQSPFYVWAARKNGIPVNGFIWNYVRTAAPKTVRITRAGTIAKNQGATDFPTAIRSLKDQGVDLQRHREWLLGMKRMRYQPGKEQLSPFFQRTVMEKSDAMIERAIIGLSHTAERFRDYDFEDRDAVERVPDKSCDWCSYRSICTTELVGGNVDAVRRSEYMEQDPFAYYDKSDPLEEV